MIVVRTRGEIFKEALPHHQDPILVVLTRPDRARGGRGSKLGLICSVDDRQTKTMHLQSSCRNYIISSIHIFD